jgi:hypothetical protein
VGDILHLPPTNFKLEKSTCIALKFSVISILLINLKGEKKYGIDQIFIRQHGVSSDQLEHARHQLLPEVPSALKTDPPSSIN